MSPAPVPADLTARARAAGQDLHRALALATELAGLARGLGAGETASYLGALAALGEGDLTAARVVEPHLDALAILHQAGLGPRLPQVGADEGSTWGVYAAQAPGMGVTAGPGEEAGIVVLDGTKPWCSLADRVSHALVTARDPDGDRLCAVDLRHPGVRSLPQPWISRGLRAITSGGLEFAQVPAVPIGPAGWYLSRPGFAWGGIGVAAVWLGGARGVARALVAAAERRAPDQVGLAHLGRADEVLWAADTALRAAGAEIDAGTADGGAGVLLAGRVRAVCAHAAEEVLTLTGRALGPAPLSFDEEHARRVADLTVYVRQHHAERDLARLGELVLARTDG